QLLWVKRGFCEFSLHLSRLRTDPPEAMQVASVLLLLIGAAHATSGDAPIGKVLELMSGLEATITKEAEEAAKLKVEKDTWCKDTAVSLGFEIQTGTDDVASLEAKIAKEAAAIGSLTEKVEELAGQVAKDEKDLQMATKIRSSDVGDFEAEEKELVATIDTLQRAIGVLERELAKAGGAALVQEGESDAAPRAALTDRGRCGPRQPKLSRRGLFARRPPDISKFMVGACKHDGCRWGKDGGATLTAATICTLCNTLLLGVLPAEPKRRAVVRLLRGLPAAAQASPELAATARAAVAPASAEKTRPAERGTGCQLSKTDTKGDNDHSAPGGEGAPKETPEGHSGSWWRGGGWAPQSTATRPREPAQNAQEDQRSKGDSSGGSWWRGGWNAAWSNTSRSSAEWGQVPLGCAFSPRSLRCPTQGWQKWQSSAQTQGTWKKRNHWDWQGEEGADWKRQKYWEKEPDAKERGREQMSGNRPEEQGWQTAGDRGLGQTERGREQKLEQNAQEVQRQTDAEQGRKQEDRGPQQDSADMEKNEGQTDAVEKGGKKRDPYDHVSGDALQETQEEADFNAEMRSWLDETAWRQSKTPKNGHLVWFHIDLQESFWQKPTPAELAEQKTKDEIVVKAAKVFLRGGGAQGAAMAGRVGMSEQEVKDRHAVLQAAAKRREQRQGHRRQKLLGI
ncbi:unnamed protein product, partial [Prorocentrum cordatum]